MSGSENQAASNVLPAWDDSAAVVDSLVSARRFQLQTDRLGAVRVLCREGDALHEVAFAELVAEARGSAARLQAQARDRALAALTDGARRAISDTLRPALRAAVRCLRRACSTLVRVGRPVSAHGVAGAPARRS